VSDNPSQEQPVVLVVDDELVVRSVLRRALSSFGYGVRLATGGAEAISELGREPPDIVVLDVSMPGVDGLQVLAHMRADPVLEYIPCLLLTGRDTIRDKVEGFGQGADDYVTKPFDLLELDLKLKALLRRAKRQEPSDVLRVGQIEAHLNSRRVIVGERVVSLSKVEMELLVALMQANGAAVSAEKLLHTVWGYPLGMGNSGLVRMHLLNLRRKIEVDPHDPQHILTVPRRGYRLRRD